MSTADKQQKNKEERIKRLQPYQWKKGKSGNLAGRPKGMTMKEYAREYLAGMTDDERQEFMEGQNKSDVWKMAEGNAPQTVEAQVKIELPQPLLDGIRNNNSNEETVKPEEED